MSAWEDVEVTAPTAEPRRVPGTNNLEIELPLSRVPAAAWARVFREKAVSGACVEPPRLEGASITVRGSFFDDGYISCIEAVRSYVAETNKAYRDALPPEGGASPATPLATDVAAERIRELFTDDG